jgi:glutamyl-Q tRNA(Asp) synthetase
VSLPGTTRSADHRAPTTRYRGRFAPSPTGPLHFGSLVAALASYCDARAAGGEWLLRIEDVDETRSRPGAESHILATLERHGFEWDGSVSRQSERTALYEEAFAQLRRGDLVFACACTRRELDAAPLGQAGERIYPGTCRNGIPDAGAHRHPHAWRVRVADTVIDHVDRLQGPQQQNLAQDVGDFVILRADGLFAYQLAVVVDDAQQDVTAIVRGADLLMSTPRQIWLQRVLGLPQPSYLHIPVAIDRTGHKLSKQTRAQPLPSSPLRSLLAAWHFLGQEPPDTSPGDTAEFWAWATCAWRAGRLPAALTLPAPL